MNLSNKKIHCFILMVIILGSVAEVISDTESTAVVEEDIIWKDQIIDLSPISFVTVAGNMIIDNCSIIGGLEIVGSGVVTILNTNWTSEEGLVINTEFSDGITLKIEDSNLMSINSALMYLGANTRLIAKNSSLKDTSEFGEGITSLEQNITFIVIDCELQGGLTLLYGGGKSRINITNNRWNSGSTLPYGGITLKNVSSVVVEDNVFDMNVESLLTVYNPRNISINRNKLILNTTKQGFTTKYVDWKYAQIGIECYNPRNFFVIKDNVLSNHGLGIFVVNELNVNLTIMKNIFYNSQYNTIFSQDGKIWIIDNVFHQSVGTLELTRAKMTIIKNNVFNNSNIKTASTDLNIYNSIENTISNNTFVSGSGIGDSIRTLDTNNTRIENNTFRAEVSDRLIYFVQASDMEIKNNVFVNQKIFLKKVENGTIYLNQFYNRSAGFEYDVTNVQWHNGSHGNYWENFMIVDENGDLISDLPFQGGGTEYDGTVYDGANDSYPLSLGFFEQKHEHENGNTTDLDKTGTLATTTDQTDSNELIPSSDAIASIGVIPVTLFIFLIAYLRLRKRKKRGLTNRIT